VVRSVPGPFERSGQRRGRKIATVAVPPNAHALLDVLQIGDMRGRGSGQTGTDDVKVRSRMLTSALRGSSAAGEG
jgi:hypothetical protein